MSPSLVSLISGAPVSPRLPPAGIAGKRQPSGVAITTLVTGVDVNPKAALTPAENARANGYDDHLVAVCSNLLSALAPGALFDVIISSPPSFPGEPRDIADRAWHAGPNYRDVAPLFDQARDRLAPGGRVYFFVSSDSALVLFSALIIKARFHARLVAERSILIESLIIYELEAL
jgi:release factor glutamine methyltransferase